MISYKKIKIKEVNYKTINAKYKELLNNKWQFLILEVNNQKLVLTKEKSLFEIVEENKFLEEAEKDIYYKTIIEKERKIDSKDFKIYEDYVNKYSPLMIKNIYDDKYIFGSVAIKTKNGFITTIRGKENFNDYVLVHEVDHEKHIIKVGEKKATLNAPLLSKLFENEKVKAIVHINHYFDEKLPYYEYAFPGTVKDSFRSNNTSFNIKYHGVIYLFDKDGKIL